MDAIALRASCGEPRVDAILRGLIGIHEACFPGRLRGYYVLGSYADGSAVAISDIDLTILFKDRLGAAERDAAEQLGQSCMLLSPVRLDLVYWGEADLEGQTVALKLGSLLIYGEDVRDRLRLPPLSRYQQTVMDTGRHFLMRILRGAERLVFPLAYPDAAGEYYGYDTIHVPEWYPPGIVHGIKELATSVSRMTTALIALQAGRYVGRKSETVAAYRDAIGDEWVDYLQALYHNGKARWGYLVPEAADERRLLRDLCRSTLGFENHFLTLYRAYLLGLLQSHDEERRYFAAERLGEVIYPDKETGTALRALLADGTERLRRAAQGALARVLEAAEPG